MEMGNNMRFIINEGEDEDETKDGEDLRSEPEKEEEVKAKAERNEIMGESGSGVIHYSPPHGQVSDVYSSMSPG